MATFKIKLEDKAAFLNRMEKAGTGLDTDQAVDNKLKGYFEVTVDEPKQLEAAKLILKQSPKINTINKMETTKKKLTKDELKEMIRQELQSVLAEKQKSKEDKENAHEAETAKNTTPQEKVRESAQESNKYNYKPHFTMSKPKFDQLYEEAIKGIPFTEDADMQEDNAMGADTGVASADDAAADAPDMGADEESQDVTITLPKELAQKLHDILMSSLGVSISDGDEVGSEDGADEAPMGDSVKVEAVSQPEPKEEKGNNAALQGKNNKVGDLHKAGGTAEKGSLKSQPEPKEEKGNNAALQGKNNKTGNLVAGKKMFE